MINGAHSHSAIRRSFSIDNGDSSQKVTLKITVRKWFFGYRNQDFFQTFFQHNSFFFETQRYQNRWSIETLKKAGTLLFSWFKLRHKNKNKFHFISIHHSFSRSGKLLGKFQDTFSRIEDSVLQCIYSFLTKCSI